MDSATNAALVITAVATVVTAVGGVIASLTLLIPILRETRANGVATSEVHTMVNQQRTDSLVYQQALISELSARGIEVPIDQSIPVPNNDTE